METNEQFKQMLAHRREREEYYMEKQRTLRESGDTEGLIALTEEYAAEFPPVTGTIEFSAASEQEADDYFKRTLTGIFMKEK